VTSISDMISPNSGR